MSGTIYAPAPSLTTLQDRCVIGFSANEKTERPRRQKRPNLNTNLAPKHKPSTNTTEEMEVAGPTMRLPFLNGAQNKKQTKKENNNNGSLSSASHKEEYKEFKQRVFCYSRARVERRHGCFMVLAVSGYIYCSPWAGHHAKGCARNSSSNPHNKPRYSIITIF